MGYDLYAEGIDDQLKQFMDADDRTKKEIVEAALLREYGGNKTSVLDVRIEHKDARIEMLKNERSDIDDEIEKEKEERQALVAKREELEDQPTYEEDLQDLFNDFANSRAVLPRFRSDADELASEYGKTLAEIEEDLRDLAEESDFNIDESRWTDDFGEGLA